MSTTQYRLDVYNTSGTLQYVLTDFGALAYIKAVNEPGILQFALRGDHPLLANLVDKWQFDVMRKPDGQAWARDFTGLYRQGQWEYGQQDRAVLVAPGLLSMLAWRIVAWYAGTASRSYFTTAPGETIAKTLVSYNCATAATVANGRLREGAITGLTVAADSATGASLDWFCAYDNVLESLQKLAPVAGGDFDLVKTSSTAWEFRWYAGQLGTNRTASVKFALELGNMAEPVYVEPRIEEKTVAIVGGKGEESARTTAVRTGTNYNVNTNNIEMFVNASDIDTANGLNARGDQKLDEAEARNKFDFKAVQSPNTLYGVHYFLGDLVTAVNPFTGASLTLKVQSVSVSLDESGQESIEPRFEVV